MSQTLRILRPCDHVVEKRVREYGRIQMTRNSKLGFTDKIPANITIIRIDNITNKDGTVEYTKNVDYSQDTSDNIIEWLNSSRAPELNEEYFIYALYYKKNILNQDMESCERCGGNGWYIDIFNSSMEIFKGSDKLLQDFIKVLFTEKQEDGYGTQIKDILGSNIYDEAELDIQISTAIEDCENQIKTFQSSLSTLTDEEKLETVEIKGIYYDRENCACYISIAIINALGEFVDLTFTI